MQERPKKPWSFGRKASSSNLRKSEAQPPKESLSPKWYRHITELPLNRYIDCLVNRNLAALVIQGFPDQNDLATAWVTIQYEYIDARGDAEYKVYASQLKELNLYNIEYGRTQMAIQGLSDLYTWSVDNDLTEEMRVQREKMASTLNKILTTDFSFDFDDPDKFIANIQRAYNRSKGLKIRIGLLKAHMEALERKFGEKEQVDETYFRSLLITLSDAAGYQLRDDITVFEFCERLRRLTQKK